MVYRIRNIVLERIRELKTTTDVELLSDLNKNGLNLSMRELNRSLVALEILGLISVRWATKDRRRIEYLERAPTVEIKSAVW